jgi:isoprenylcysteine carboxyl methyltransferase (ICMT) family protein YpbQ
VKTALLSAVVAAAALLCAAQAWPDATRVAAALALQAAVLVAAVRVVWLIIAEAEDVWDDDQAGRR